MCVILYNNIPDEKSLSKWNTPFSDTHSPFSSTTRSSSEGIFKVSTAVSPQKGTAELDSLPSLKCVRILSSYLRSKTHTKQLLGGFKRCWFSSSSFSDDPFFSRNTFGYVWMFILEILKLPSSTMIPAVSLPSPPSSPQMVATTCWSRGTVGPHRSTGRWQALWDLRIV